MYISIMCHRTGVSFRSVGRSHLPGVITQPVVWLEIILYWWWSGDMVVVVCCLMCGSWMWQMDHGVKYYMYMYNKMWVYLYVSWFVLSWTALVAQLVRTHSVVWCRLAWDNTSFLFQVIHFYVHVCVGGCMWVELCLCVAFSEHVHAWSNAGTSSCTCTRIHVHVYRYAVFSPGPFRSAGCSAFVVSWTALVVQLVRTPASNTV